MGTEEVEVNKNQVVDNRKNQGYSTANFMQDQFKTLREEIKESNARTFYIVTSGIIGTSLISILAEKFQVSWICLLLPFFVIAMVLLEMGESNNVYRAGVYIRENIESRISNFQGWETWLLSDEQNQREGEKLVNIAFAIIFGIYYFCSALLGFLWMLSLSWESSLQCWVPNISLPSVLVSFLNWLESDWHKIIVICTLYWALYITLFVCVIILYYKKCKRCIGAR
jgi:hypothetical protein